MTDQLHLLAKHWAKATGRSLSTLGSKVHADSRFFSKLGNDKGCTTATFEKFLAFFRDGKNWPDGMIPSEAICLLDNFENIAASGDLSTGNGGEVSREVAL